MTTIGQAGFFNIFAYSFKYDPITGTNVLDPTAPPLPTGWEILHVNDDVARSGEFSVTLINYETNELYVAARGTQSFFPDLIPADAGIVLNNAPLARINFETDVITALKVEFPGLSITGGGGSLAGLVMAGASAETGIPVVVQNAPKTLDTLKGQFGDKYVT